MTQRNRRLLTQLEDPAVLGALLDLPENVLRRVEKSDTGGRGEAVQVALALAVQLLTTTALRRRNLTHLDIERHLLRYRVGGKPSWRLSIPAEDVKNARDIDQKLSARTQHLLETYLERYRPRLHERPGPCLFPGRGGRARSADSFAELIKKFLKRELSLKMNAHLFRHLIVKILLDDDPNNLEFARLMLNHSTTRTTLRAYANLTADRAGETYDEIIERRRREASRPVRGRATATSWQTEVMRGRR